MSKNQFPLYLGMHQNQSDNALKRFPKEFASKDRFEQWICDLDQDGLVKIYGNNKDCAFGVTRDQVEELISMLAHSIDESTTPITGSFGIVAIPDNVYQNERGYLLLYRAADIAKFERLLLEYWPKIHSGGTARFRRNTSDEIKFKHSVADDNVDFIFEDQNDGTAVLNAFYYVDSIILDQMTPLDSMIFFGTFEDPRMNPSNLFEPLPYEELELMSDLAVPCLTEHEGDES